MQSTFCPRLSILLGLPALVEVVGATCRFGDIVALDDVSLALQAGELAFVVGPSGAGKTTLLKLINREMRPTSGEVWIDGHAAHALRSRRIPTLRRRVGVVYQDYKLLPRLTALENVAFAIQVCYLGVSDEEAHDRALDAVEAVGLGGREGAFPDELSGGQQQRVAIARAVVVQPPVLIADEPTGNLDPQLSSEIMALFAEFQQVGTTVLIASHNLMLIKRMHKRVLVLDQGRLIDDFRPEVRA